MHTIIVTDKRLSNEYKKHEHLFNCFSELITHCEWFENGESLDEMIPNLLSSIQAHATNWKVIILHEPFVTDTYENPFFLESKLIKLTNMLLSYVSKPQYICHFLLIKEPTFDTNIIRTDCLGQTPHFTKMRFLYFKTTQNEQLLSKEIWEYLILALTLSINDDIYLSDSFICNHLYEANIDEDGIDSTKLTETYQEYYKNLLKLESNLIHFKDKRLDSFKPNQEQTKLQFSEGFLDNNDNGTIIEIFNQKKLEFLNNHNWNIEKVKTDIQREIPDLEYSILVSKIAGVDVIQPYIENSQNNFDKNEAEETHSESIDGLFLVLFLAFLSFSFVYILYPTINLMYIQFRSIYSICWVICSLIIFYLLGKYVQKKLISKPTLKNEFIQTEHTPEVRTNEKGVFVSFYEYCKKVLIYLYFKSILQSKVKKDGLEKKNKEKLLIDIHKFEKEKKACYHLLISLNIPIIKDEVSQARFDINEFITFDLNKTYFMLDNFNANFQLKLADTAETLISPFGFIKSIKLQNIMGN